MAGAVLPTRTVSAIVPTSLRNHAILALLGRHILGTMRAGVCAPPAWGAALSVRCPGGGLADGLAHAFGGAGSPGGKRSLRKEK